MSHRRDKRKANHMHINRRDRPFIIALCLIDVAIIVVLVFVPYWWLSFLILLGLIGVVLIFDRL